MRKFGKLILYFLFGAVWGAQTPQAQPQTEVKKPQAWKRVSVSLWGGYSFSTRSDYIKNVESVGDRVTVADLVRQNDSKLKGFATGFDAYLGETVQFGLNAAFLPGHQITRRIRDTNSANAFTLKSSLDYAPLIASVRYFFFRDLYASAGVGAAFLLNGKESFANDADGTIQNTNTLSDPIPWNFSYSRTAFALQGRLGYDYRISARVRLGIVGIFTYIQTKLKSSNVDQFAQGSISEYAHATWHFTPAFSLSYQF